MPLEEVRIVPMSHHQMAYLRTNVCGISLSSELLLSVTLTVIGYHTVFNTVYVWMKKFI